jgi:hypothetical protein
VEASRIQRTVTHAAVICSFVGPRRTAQGSSGRLRLGYHDLLRLEDQEGALGDRSEARQGVR